MRVTSTLCVYQGGIRGENWKEKLMQHGNVRGHAWMDEPRPIQEMSMCDLPCCCAVSACAAASGMRVKLLQTVLAAAILMTLKEEIFMTVRSVLAPKHTVRH